MDPLPENALEPAGCHTALGGSDFFHSKLEVKVSWLAQGLAVDLKAVDLKAVDPVSEGQ